MGEGDSQLPGGQADCHAQRRWRGNERDCRAGAGAFWRRCGPDLFDADDLQARGELPCGSSRTQCLLWRARVWHVRGGERNGGAWRADSLRLDLLCVFRLCQARDPAGGADAGAFAVCLYPRLDCVGRGWADASADRAPDGVARGSGADGLSSRGRERDGGGLAAGSGAQGAELLCADAGRICRSSTRRRTTSMPE